MKGKFEDLSGMKFGRLTVLERAEKAADGHSRWRCKCECGNICTVRGSHLKSGQKSCGCLGGKFKDLTGKRFGRLTVLERAENKGRHTAWRCKCECNAEVVVLGESLKSGKILSCGCLRRESSIQLNTTHGLHDSKIYKVWAGIKNRCFNPNSSNYKNYGGRGITICEEWKDNFPAFYDYVSKLPHFDKEGYSLDRIDNNGNYEPDNLKFSTVKEQGRNRRTNIFVEYQGEKTCLKDAAEKAGLNYGTLKIRYKKGDRGERLFRPVKK